MKTTRFLIILCFAVVVLVGFVLVFKNKTCMVGGVIGEQCNCIGKMILLESDKNTDGIELYRCVGIILPSR